MKKWIACAGMIVVLLMVVFAAEYWDDVMITEEESLKGTGETEEKDVEWVIPDREYLEYYGLGEFETDLPIIHIDTDGQRISKENKIWSTIAVTEADEKGETRSVMETPDWDASIMLNYRGASSYSQFDKKQYRIKFYKEAGSTNAKDYEFLGMGKNSEWVLNGPFLDKTLIRNRLVYGLGRQIFEWAPDCRYAELFIDGEYQGVYLAIEPVTNGESRLRLCEFGLANGDTAYIVKRDRVDTEEGALNVYGHYAGKTNNDLFIDYPTDSHLTEIQREWITNDIDAFERVLYSEEFADPECGYANYIDVDNFVDYVVLNEVVMNADAGELSTYVYKELGGKLQLAVWDYNNCFDNYQWFAEDYSEFYMQDAAWFSRLLQDRAFVDKVVARYEELRQDVLSEEYLYSQIDSYVEELGPAIQRNYAVWGYSFHDKLIADTNEFHTNPTSYEESIYQLKRSIHARLYYLDGHITDLYDGCVN